MLNAVRTLAVAVAETTAAQSTSALNRHQSLTAINSVIRNYGKTLFTAPQKNLTSSAQMSLLKQFGQPNGMQIRTAITPAMHGELKKIIPQQITVAPDVPVMQSEGACDAYSSKVLKGYEAVTSDPADAPASKPKTLFEKLGIMFHGVQDVDTERPQSGAEMLDLYRKAGPFTLMGAGLAKTGYLNHAMPVMAVVKVEVDGAEKTVLIAIDRNDFNTDPAAKAVSDLTVEKGSYVNVMPQAVLNQHPELKDEFDQSCIHLIDADAALHHSKEIRAHYAENGLNLWNPAVEYLKRGLKPITPEQEQALKQAVASAYQRGEVETYKDVDYSSLDHHKKKMS